MNPSNDTSRARLTRRGLLAAATLLGGAAVWRMAPAVAMGGDVGVELPPPAMDAAPAATGATTEVAVLAGGCFWGVQAVFQHVKGVTRAVSGYAGGDAGTAKYERIGTGRTGHAEAVRVSFDPRQISFGQILQIYFSVAHNPTELNRQGPDRGPQYRSAVFPQNAEQARVARAYIAQLDQTGRFNGPIVTTIEEQKPFFEAEAYHQDYLVLHPNQPYIVINDKPKIENLRRLFPARYRAEPVLVRASA